MKENPLPSPFFAICEGATKAFNDVGDTYATSTQSLYDLVQSRRPRPRAELPKKATRAAEADEHENGQSWALIPSTGAGQHAWTLFKLQK